MARWLIKCKEPRNLWIAPLDRVWRFATDGDLETDDDSVAAWAMKNDGLEVIDTKSEKKAGKAEEVKLKKPKKKIRGGK